MAKVLIIDDNEPLAKAWAMKLALAGFDVDTAAHGRAGLVKARTNAPDLILLDVLMPGMHGLDLLKWVRDVPWLIKVPVVLLTERYLEQEILDECREWGAIGCLVKEQLTPNDLVAHVQATLKEHPVTNSPAP
ncbi:MAG: response regulator [Candidatus Omnitrophica bacterium]|nr:response regulator [Candidatus Omnitrophota bacterium]